MNTTQFLEEYQRYLLDWQKKLFDTWLGTTSSEKTEFNLSGDFEKVLKFQEEAVKTYLEAQEKTNQMMLQAQRQFWNDYFEMLRKQAAGMNKTSESTPVGSRG